VGTENWKSKIPPIASALHFPTAAIKKMGTAVVVAAAAVAPQHPNKQQTAAATVAVAI